ncbi:MAG: DNA-directed RNA polymerase subunit delta [Tenericutes bacterium]|nr:DNA-directed RNA polymerase subunit delta [Mycoplasmatota bacterium]
MTDRKNMSLMELANQVLLNNGKAMTFTELYDIICAEKALSDDEKASIISQVYADFITSAKFIYVGEDEWDIKGRQTIDLWDKDGAYYDEYPDYEEELSLFDEKSDDEYSIPEVVEENEEETQSKYEEDFNEDDIEDTGATEYDAFIEDDEDYVEDEEDIKIKKDLDAEGKKFEVEEEEKEEFNDEEYNEYMDDYEEMYED